MKNLCLYLAIGALSCLFSCGHKQKKLEDKVEALMKLHDEEMAKMDLIFKLKKDLKVLKDSSASDSLAKVYDQRIQSLELADEAMMNWMRNYKVPDVDDDLDSKHAYYDQEFQKMMQVKVQMNQSIDSAKSVLSQH